MHPTQKIRSEKRGTLCAIASGLLYGFLGYFGVTLMKSGLSIFNVAFFRFAVASLFLLITVIATKAYQRTNPKECLLALLNGGIFYGIPGILFFMASKYISTGQAMVIFFIFPIFVMLLNRIFLKSPIKPQYLLSFSLILGGLVLLADIGELALDFFGIILSLISALSYAIYIFISKKELTSLPPLLSSFLVSLGCMIACGSAALIEGSLVFPTQSMQWLNILGLGIICSALPIVLLFQALDHIPADKASLLSVLEPVFVVIVGVLFLHEVLSLVSFFGILLILLGSMTVSIKWKALAFTKWTREV